MDIARLVMEDGTLPDFTSIGSYPMLYVTKHGDILCASCAVESLLNDDDPAVAGDVYYEGTTLDCDDCGYSIESAYGDPYTYDSEI